MAALGPAFTALRSAWAARTARERQAVVLAAAVLGAYLLWAVALAPAIATLRQAPAKRAALEAQLQQMHALAAEAQALRSTPALPAAQAQSQLAAAATRLGDKARLMLQGDRAVLTLNGLEGAPLAQWLAEVRSTARVRVIEAQLNRTPQGGYTGSVVLAYGGQR